MVEQALQKVVLRSIPRSAAALLDLPLLSVFFFFFFFLMQLLVSGSSTTTSSSSSSDGGSSSSRIEHVNQLIFPSRCE